MVHGFVVLVPPPITLWQLRPGWLLLYCGHASSGANRICGFPEIIDVPCGQRGGVGVEGGMSGPVDVDALASTRIGWILVFGLGWPSAEATGDCPGEPGRNGRRNTGTLHLKSPLSAAHWSPLRAHGNPLRPSRVAGGGPLGRPGSGRDILFLALLTCAPALVLAAVKITTSPIHEYTTLRTDTAVCTVPMWCSAFLADSISS